MSAHLDKDQVRPYVRGQVFLAIIARYTTKPPIEHAVDSRAIGGGKTYTAPCPLGCGSVDDALVLWPDRPDPAWWCSRGCNGEHNASIFDFVMKMENLPLDQAISRVAEMAGLIGVGSSKFTPPPRTLNPATNFVHIDMSKWQSTAGIFTKRCADRLWEGEVSQHAREYLLARGLTETTLKQARVGYHDLNIRLDNARWGLPPTKPHGVQSGIVVPYVDGGGTVSAIKIKPDNPRIGRNGKPIRFNFVPKGGESVGIYGKFTDRGYGVTVLQESELDALLGWQYQPAFTWLSTPAGTHLHKGDVPPGVLILAMDGDEAGKLATALHLADHPDAIVAPPYPDGCKDLTEVWQREGHTAVTTWMRQVENLLPEVTF